MSFTSVQLILFALATSTLAALLSGGARLALILIASLVFAATYMPSLIAAAPLALFILAGYATTRLAASPRGRFLTGPAMAILVAAFIWLKRYPFVEPIPALPFPYVLVGLSYILFRMLHVVFDVRAGLFAPPPPLRYVAYLIFFPSFLSGPINQYPPFARDLDTPAPLDREAAFQTLTRFLLGFAKVAVAGEILFMIQQWIVARLPGAEGPVLGLLYAAAAGFYMIYLYVNFSGYTDLAICIGRLFGIVLPENFRRPFMASNFQDFWSRWHITLSEWFKVYFFNPLLIALMRRFRQPWLAPYFSVLALFVVFLVLGAWHGASWETLLVGFLLAVGVSINKLWQIEMAKRLGKKGYRALQASPLYVWASRGLSLAWISVALTTFWIPVEGAAALVGRLGPLWTVGSLILLSTAFAVSVLLVVGTFDRFSGWVHGGRPSRPALRYGMLGAAIAGLLFAVPLVNSSTDFVYQAF